MSEIIKPIFLDETGQSILTALQQIASRTAGFAGPGVPSGGSAGQILSKTSSTDYDTQWVDASAGIYWATYGSTLYSAIANAYNAGKLVACIYNSRLYILTFYNPNEGVRISSFTFTSLNNDSTVGYYIKIVNVNAWTNGTINIGSSISPYTSTPAALGTAAAGSSDNYARGDHVHAMPSVNDIGAEPAITEITVSTAGNVSQTLDAGSIYHFTGTLTSLDITLNTAGTGVLPIYCFDFDSGSVAPAVSLPSAVTMPNSFSISSGKHYEINIFNEYGVYTEW